MNIWLVSGFFRQADKIVISFDTTSSDLDIRSPLFQKVISAYAKLGPGFIKVLKINFLKSLTFPQIIILKSFTIFRRKKKRFSNIILLTIVSDIIPLQTYCNLKTFLYNSLAICFLMHIVFAHGVFPSV